MVVSSLGILRVHVGGGGRSGAERSGAEWSGVERSGAEQSKVGGLFLSLLKDSKQPPFSAHFFRPFHPLFLFHVFLFFSRHLHYMHPGVLDIRGRSDFSRFDPRPERPHFSNFGPPAERRPFFVERRPFCETPPAVGL